MYSTCTVHVHVHTHYTQNVYVYYSSILQDTLVVDEPRVRRQVRRYGDDLLETIVDMDESQEEIMDILPARGRRGWTKLECFKTEKGLLIYGYVLRDTSYVHVYPSICLSNYPSIHPSILSV